jgi:hypothetical protein
MDRPVPITVDLIATITGLPIDGENLEKYLEDKTKAKAISDEIKAKYGVECGNRGIRISDINDLATRFSTKLLGCNLIRKCRKEEVPSSVVVACRSVCKGELNELGPIPLEIILRILLRHPGLGL